MVEQLTIARPDDCHAHFRDGPVLESVVRETAQRFARAVVMPNLDLPVTGVAQALAYKDRIMRAVPPDQVFEPLMTLYLTDNTKPSEIVRARASGQIFGVKLYPAGATTHAGAGVTQIAKVYPALEAMEETGLPLLVHGEVVDPRVDIFDRERVFIETELVPLVRRFGGLRVVLEHVTTKDGVDFVAESPERVAATITAHHLLLNRNAMFAGGLRPHHYCLPVLKREVHRETLVAAATSGNRKFFLGTDSAPHARPAKESACGCAGMYTAPAALELYAEAFEAARALDKLEAFASFHGADFYRLPRNTESVRLEKRAWQVPRELPLGDESVVVPFRAGTLVGWVLSE